MTTITRPTETICPSWCAGHHGGYQDWEDITGDNRQMRDHGDVGVTVGGANVYVLQVEDEDHSLNTPVVQVYVDNLFSDSADLTPAQARELAQVLVSAAERAEAQR